jgi:hypothetical protein
MTAYRPPEPRLLLTMGAAALAVSLPVAMFAKRLGGRAAMGVRWFGLVACGALWGTMLLSLTLVFGLYPLVACESAKGMAGRALVMVSGMAFLLGYTVDLYERMWGWDVPRVVYVGLYYGAIVGAPVLAALIWIRERRNTAVLLTTSSRRK